MRSTLLRVVVGIVGVLALTAGAAQANGGDRSTIVFRAELAGFDFEACDGAGGLLLSLSSPDGAPLGEGVSCITSFEDGCTPFFAGCQSIIGATITLDFGHGTVTVPSNLRETYSTPSAFVQRGLGRISDGTGEFAGVKGRLKGGGPGEWQPDGSIVSDFVFTLHLKDDDGD